MTGRLFFDTNLLIYGMDPKDGAKRARSVRLLKQAFGQSRMVISPQILNECYAVLVHKRRLVSAFEAASYLAALYPACTAPLDAQTHRAAIVIEERYRFSWWDSVAIASALQAGCHFFVSEDMSDGQTVDTLHIVNPFTPHASATLALT
ncbi:PIN domain-containing protein [Methylobacterium sp. W2]|uniref:PIN domain-containing protein n=1 Tax=Methylobacterium sp. W2 TaxID=2598107 RepID=UPI001D0C96FD|nr:PIN domain-containing protein [Methylobacterium sp. W2]MCC0807610.1 PIN domain-containing protein [Methylobacterium sp. W2]